MKASEMTNEMLAKTVDEFVNAFHNDSDKSILREVAERLRKRIEFTPEMATEMCRREAVAKKQFDKIAAKKERDIGSLKIDIAILSDALFDLLSRAYRDEKYGRYQAMLAIINNGREGHFYKDEVIKMFCDEFCDCVVDHEACTVERSEGAIEEDCRAMTGAEQDGKGERK